MDEQMIECMARAMEPIAWEMDGSDRDQVKYMYARSTTLSYARAAHSVIAGKVAELEGAQDALEELLDEAEDICVALAKSMDIALVAAGDGVAPFVVERAAKSTEALREFSGRASKFRAALAPHPKGIE